MIYKILLDNKNNIYNIYDNEDYNRSYCFFEYLFIYVSLKNIKKIIIFLINNNIINIKDNIFQLYVIETLKNNKLDSKTKVLKFIWIITNLLLPENLIDNSNGYIFLHQILRCKKISKKNIKLIFKIYDNINFDYKNIIYNRNITFMDIAFINNNIYTVKELLKRDCNINTIIIKNYIKHNSKINIFLSKIKYIIL